MARVNSGNRVISIHFRGDRLTQGISQDGHLKQHFHSPQSKQVPRLGRDCIVQSRLRVLVYKYQFYPIIAPFIKSGPITTVSRILHHIHPCLIYEAIMRHFRDKYEAIMKQIYIIFSKNEVLGPAFLFTAKPL